MAKQAASEAEMLDAIGALVGAAIAVLNNSNPLPRLHSPGLDELEDAYIFAKGVMTPTQWEHPTFVVLAEVADAAWPAIHCRKLGLDRSCADTELAGAVEHAQDFMARTRPTLS